jgi:hypothetical protein
MHLAQKTSYRLLRVLLLSAARILWNPQSSAMLNYRC